MLKLPAGSGCDSGDDAQQQQQYHQHQQQSPYQAQQHVPYQQPPQSHFVPNHVHNLPVAVPVPAITRSRSGGVHPGQSVGGGLGGQAQGQRKKTVHQFSFRSLLGNDVIRMADYAGKVVMVVNVASHCNSTTKAYTQLNELSHQFPDLVILGCPCNQFGHQENLVGEEILLSLKHIRPGNGFEPNFRLTEKVEVNGANAHAVFNFLKLSLPFPSDRTLMDEMSSPGGVFSHPMRIIWMPVSRADVSWNFEKFLIGPDGVPFRRYSPKTDVKMLIEDIENLMNGDYNSD